MLLNIFSLITHCNDFIAYPEKPSRNGLIKYCIVLARFCKTQNFDSNDIIVMSYDVI